MSEAAALYLLIAAIVTATTVIGSALFWLIKPRFTEAVRETVRDEIGPIRDQISETHKQVTENHHSNETPTVLDRLDDVHQEVTAVRDDLNNHLLLSSRAQSDMWRAIEAIAHSEPPTIPADTTPGV